MAARLAVPGGIQMRVFVSSRISDDELADERRTAYETLSRWLEPVMFEYAPAAPKHVKDWWREEIATCDLFVLVLHRTLRWAVFDEWQTARRHLGDSSILVFLKEPELTRNGQLEVDEQKGEPSISQGDQDYFHSVVTKPKQGEIESSEQFAEALMQALYAIPGIDSEPLRVLHKLRQVFVAPVGFDDYADQLRASRLVFLTGPPHIGKTATGLMLLEKMQQEGAVAKTRRFASIEEVRAARRLESAGILLDDPFGQGGKFFTVAPDPEIILQLKGANIVVVTSREEVFNEARESTRLGEMIDDSTVLRFSEDSYSELQLGEILRRHCAYMLRDHYPEHERISAEQANWAMAHERHILSALGFPHNIDFFAEQLLRTVTEETSIWDAINDARRIETAVSNWFQGLSVGVQAYACLAALFPNLDEALFRELMQLTQGLLQLGSVDLSDCQRQVQPYISQWPVRFRHPSYREGVVMGLERSWADRATQVCDAVLPHMAEEDLTYLSEVLRGLPRVAFTCIWQRDAQRAAAASDRASRVIERFSRDYAPGLWGARGMPQEQVNMPFKPVFHPAGKIVVWVRPTGESGAPPMVPRGAWGSAVNEVEIEAGWRVVSQQWSAGYVPPEGIAFREIVDELAQLAEKQGLQESWHMIWARTYEDIRKLTRQDIIPEELLADEVAAEELRTYLSEFVSGVDALVNRSAVPLEHITIGDVAGDIPLWRLMNDVKWLQEHGYTLQGPLLPQPDFERARRVFGLTAAYPDELLVEGFRKYWTCYVEAYQEMCERNFPGLLDRFSLYGLLPCDVYALIERPGSDVTEHWPDLPTVTYSLSPAGDPNSPLLKVALLRGDVPAAGDVADLAEIKEYVGWDSSLAHSVTAVFAFNVSDHGNFRKEVYSEILKEVQRVLGRSGDYGPPRGP